MAKRIGKLIICGLLGSVATAASATTNIWVYSTSDWIVPYSTRYSFVIAGGAGGDNIDPARQPIHTGGGGSLVAADIFFDAGTRLTFQIGQRGQDGDKGAGGGGATALLADSALELVAGGGGGAGRGGNGVPGATGLNGTTTGDAAGGTGGLGGQAGHETLDVVILDWFGGGGGGAGALSPGQTSYNGLGGGMGIGGRGPTGGIGYHDAAYQLEGGGGSGAFGGGSGEGVDGGGGGGGGYSGGAGGDSYSYYQFPSIRYTGRGGGGGGSYNPWAGTSGVFPGANPAAGYALISFDYTAPPPPPPPPPPAVPEPASWAMLVVGFAATGSALRNARRGARAGAAV